MQFLSGFLQAAVVEAVKAVGGGGGAESGTAVKSGVWACGRVRGGSYRPQCRRTLSAACLLCAWPVTMCFTCIVSPVLTTRDPWSPFLELGPDEMKELGPGSYTSEIKEVMFRPRFVLKGLSGHKVSERVSPTGPCWVH